MRGYSSFDVHNWLDATGKEPSKVGVNLALELIQEELEELKQAAEQNSNEEILDAVVDLHWVLQNLLFFRGISARQFERFAGFVSESNWSKLCSTKEEAEQTVRLYKEGIHPDKMGQKIETKIIETNGLWVVMREDGKIMKSHLYKTVNQLDGR